MLKTSTYEILPECAVFPTFEPMKKITSFNPAHAFPILKGYKHLQTFMRDFVVGFVIDSWLRGKEEIEVMCLQDCWRK
jgi:hypothetical protein